MKQPEKALVGGLIVAHGGLAEELVAVAKHIVGDVDHLAAASVGWNEDAEKTRDRLEDCLRNVDQGAGIVILTDMFGGTPSNVALTFLDRDDLEIVTGVNLPMVVKLASQSGDERVHELAEKIRDQGRSQISIAGKLLGR